MNAVTQRLSEPSTWAGIAGVLQALKPLFPHYAAGIDAATAMAGVVAMMRADPGTPKP